MSTRARITRIPLALCAGFALLLGATPGCCRHERELSGDRWVEPLFSSEEVRTRGKRVVTSLHLGKKELWIVDPLRMSPVSWRLYVLADGRSHRIQSVNALLTQIGSIQTGRDAHEIVRILTLWDDLSDLWIEGLPGRRLLPWEAERTIELCRVDPDVVDFRLVDRQMVVERVVGVCGEPDKVIRVRELFSAAGYRFEVVQVLTEEVLLMRYR